MEKDGKITVISIFLALICLGILGYIVYYKTNSTIPKPDEKPNKEISETEEKVEEPKESEPTIDVEEIAMNLYRIIGTNPEFREEDALDFDSLSESIRDSIVISYLKNETGCEENLSYNKEYFENAYKKIFNQEKLDNDGICLLNNGEYECNYYCNEFGPSIYNKFENYEIVEDGIIIYEKAAHLDYADDGKIYLKKNGSDSESLASFDSLEEIDDSVLKYDLKTYKHVFNKSEDGYYWVSSESVKQ